MMFVVEAGNHLDTHTHTRTEMNVYIYRHKYWNLASLYAAKICTYMFFWKIYTYIQWDQMGMTKNAAPASGDSPNKLILWPGMVGAHPYWWTKPIRPIRITRIASCFMAVITDYRPAFKIQLTSEQRSSIGSPFCCVLNETSPWFDVSGCKDLQNC